MIIVLESIDKVPLSPVPPLQLVRVQRPDVDNDDTARADERRDRLPYVFRSSRIGKNDQRGADVRCAYRFDLRGEAVISPIATVMMTSDGEEDESICVGVKAHNGQSPIVCGSGERPNSGCSHH
jgi:hypothetical protein